MKLTNLVFFSFIFLVTNKITADSTTEGRIDFEANNKSNKPSCVLCEFVMSKLDELLENKNTEVN